MPRSQPACHRSTAAGGSLSVRVGVLAVAALIGAVALAPAAPAPANLGQQAGQVGQADEASQGGEVVRVAGADRIETAVQAARTARSDRDPGNPLDAAVLARANDYPDALAGVSLADAIDAPLLFTDRDRLADPVAEFLDDVLTDDALVVALGGEAAVAPSVLDDLEHRGWRTERLAGSDRYATAAAIARAASDPSLISDRFADEPTSTPDTIALASGQAFPDALAMSVPAAEHGWPLLLTEQGRLPAATRELLDDWELDRVEVAGGRQAIGEAVAEELAGLGLAVTRTAGADRYETSAELAHRFWHPSGGFAEDRLVVATGEGFADGLAGGALATTRGAGLLLTPTGYPSRAVGGVLLERVPDQTTVLGGTAAVSDATFEGLSRLVSTTGQHVAVPRVAPAPGTTIELGGDAALPRFEITDAHGTPTSDSTVQLRAGDDMLEIDTRIVGDALIAELAEPPAALEHGGEVTVELSGMLHTREPGHAHGREDEVTAQAPISARYTLSAPLETLSTAEGFVALSGTGEVAGEHGQLFTYSLEREPGAGVPLADFAVAARGILTDEERGWASHDGYRLQRVEPDEADIRVVLASPATTDELCARAGLDTAGRYSCWNGEFAALNAMRWRQGAAPFAGQPIETYRTYLVNHEVGHGLGYDHHSCPAPGEAAPVMVQQTISTGGCEPNGWPYPQGPDGAP